MADYHDPQLIKTIIEKIIKGSATHNHLYRKWYLTNSLLMVFLGFFFNLFQRGKRAKTNSAVLDLM